MTARIELRLLGRFVVLRDGVEVVPAEFGGRKVRELLRILATRRGEFVSNDVLTEALWPDRPPADPSANVQVLVNRARRATGSPTLIRTGPGGYTLTDGPDCITDADQLGAEFAAASHLSGSAALDAYRRALTAFVGEPLAEDGYAAWAEQARTRIARMRQEARERAAELAIEQGDASLAVEYADAAAAAEPLREGAALLFVRALALAGDTAAALAHYDRYRRTLADELGLDPSPAAQQVQASLLDGSIAQRPRAAAPIQRVPGDFAGLRFGGRSVEVESVVARISTAGIVVLAGASGTGKSRLLAEIGMRQHVFAARAYWPERSLAWSLARALLRELLTDDVTAADVLPLVLRSAIADLLPELEPQGGDAWRTSAIDTEAESQRALLVEAFVRLLGRVAHPALVVDDLQWADPSSLQLLATVHERLPGVALVVAYRPDEVTIGDDVSALLARFDDADVIELGELPVTAIGDLVADPPLADALARSTDRSPLAIAEVLRALSREGLVAVDRHGRWHGREAPDSAGSAHLTHRAVELGLLGQRRVLARRISRCTGAAAEILRLLALVGREVSARTLAIATNASERAVLDELAHLSAVGLTRLGDRGWTTAHDMIAAVVIDVMTDADRGRLHAHVAAALTADQADDAEIARHWLRAGESDKAAQAFVTAAERALEAFADAEAESLADAGFTAGATPTVKARLFELRAQARGRRGDIAGARTDLQAALTTYQHGPTRSAVLAQLATLASGADDLRRASELAELAIVEAGHDDAARAKALEVASVIDMNLDRAERSAARAAESLAIYQRGADSRGAARILDARAMAAFLDGAVAIGTQLLHEVANLFEDSGDLMRVITPRSTRGHGLVFLGRPADGLADARAALEVARSLGQPEGQAFALWHMSEALSALGRVDEARARGHESLDVAQRIGHRGWTATGWRAIGIAEQAADDHRAAVAAFDASLNASANLELFACWAAARMALSYLALGDVDSAGPLVTQALGEGPPLGHYEARLAQAELAARRNDPAAAALAAAALIAADAGGVRQHRDRLVTLAAV